MRFAFAIFATVLLFSSTVRADSSDDTLKFYLGKSDVVVLGKIKSMPFGVMGEAGVVNYSCDFEVLDVLKNAATQPDQTSAGKTIRISIVRFESDQTDRHPLITQGAKCIAFLKREPGANVPRWSTADFWFGIQQPIPTMAKSLERVAKEMQADTAQHKADP